MYAALIFMSCNKLVNSRKEGHQRFAIALEGNKVLSKIRKR